MQRLAFESIVYRIIQIISGEWMSNITHVYTNLMGTSGFEMDFKK